ncbi:MAG: beta-1,6-N-acetylglucosaminyltransferase [Pirellulales bacterium]
MKTAFLFMVYDEILHEDLWHDHFFTGVSDSKYSIYIHYKPELELMTKHYKEKVLPFCTETEWAKVSLLIAQNLLLSEALKDKANERFVILSQSCVPVKTFDHVGKVIYQTDKSFFNERPKEFLRRYRIIETIFGEHQVYKASAWCILNRKHASLLAARDGFFSEQWMRNFSMVFAPEEVAYLSLLRREGLGGELEVVDDLTYATTFTNWGPHPEIEGWTGYVMPEYKHPRPTDNRVKDYEEISEEEMNDLVGSDSLFARKFKKTCRIAGSEISLKDFLKPHVDGND